MSKKEPNIHGVGKSGALTSGDALPMWQVPESLLKSVARRMKKGNDKGYPIHNWRGGLDDVAFLRDRANHAATHLMHLLNGNHTIDDAQGNLDALSWFCAVLNEALRLHPETVAKAFYDNPRHEVVVVVVKTRTYTCQQTECKKPATWKHAEFDLDDPNQKCLWCDDHHFRIVCSNPEEIKQ